MSETNSTTPAEQSAKGTPIAGVDPLAKEPASYKGGEKEMPEVDPQIGVAVEQG